MHVVYCVICFDFGLADEAAKGEADESDQR